MSDSVQCRKCLDWFPSEQVNADELCEICFALSGLRAAMEKRGLIRPEHPELFENRSALPPADRE